MKRSYFCRPRPHLHAAGTVVTDAIVSGVVVDDRVVIDIVNHSRIHVVDVPVVVESVAVPISSLVAEADVAEAVIDTPVVADVTTPIAAVVTVTSAIIAPIAGSPECSLVGRPHPCSWNPVVAAGVIVPIPGSPDVAVARARRLFILRQWRRRLGSVLSGLIGTLVIGLV